MTWVRARPWTGRGDTGRDAAGGRGRRGADGPGGGDGWGAADEADEGGTLLAPGRRRTGEVDLAGGETVPGRPLPLPRPDPDAAPWRDRSADGGTGDGGRPGVPGGPHRGSDDGLREGHDGHDDAGRAALAADLHHRDLLERRRADLALLDPAELSASVTEIAARLRTVVVRRPFSADVGLLVVRLTVGLLAMVLGARVLLGAPGGSLRPAVQGVLAAQGFARPDLSATHLGVVALVAGLLVAVGVLTSLAAGGLLALTLTWLGLGILPAAGASGAVLAPLLASVLVAVAVLVGPGRISADAGRAWERAQSATGFVGLLIGVGTALAALLFLR